MFGPYSITLAALLLLTPWPSVAEQTSVARVLIYSATRDFRHDSIPTAIQAMRANQYLIYAEFDNTEDQTQFNDQVLAGYDALVFLDNTGEGELLISWEFTLPSHG
jgi:hypothetical protein